MSSVTGTSVASASPVLLTVIWKVSVSPGLAVLVGPNVPSLVLTSLTAWMSGVVTVRTSSVQALVAGALLTSPL